MIDRRADVLATCREIHYGDPKLAQPNDLNAYLGQVMRFAWAPAAQAYDTQRSSGSTGPIEAHRVQLVSDPARNGFTAFAGYIRRTETLCRDMGWPWGPYRTATGHLGSIEACLCGEFPLPRKTLDEMAPLLNHARLIQLEWTQTARQAEVERRVCRHCHRTDLGSRPRGGLCTSCVGFRADWGRLPTAKELRRFGETGRWRIRA